MLAHVCVSFFFFFFFLGGGGGGGVVSVSCVCVWPTVYVCICHSCDCKKSFLAKGQK